LGLAFRELWRSRDQRIPRLRVKQKDFLTRAKPTGLVLAARVEADNAGRVFGIFRSAKMQGHLFRTGIDVSLRQSWR